RLRALSRRPKPRSPTPHPFTVPSTGPESSGRSETFSPGAAVASAASAAVDERHGDKNPLTRGALQLASDPLGPGSRPMGPQIAAGPGAIGLPSDGPPGEQILDGSEIIGDISAVRK